MRNIILSLTLLICFVFGSISQDNAIYLSQSMPGDMEPGVNYNVSVSMKNTGTTTWMPGTYFLRLLNPTDAVAKSWSVNTVQLLKPVTPGEMTTFYFRTRAPIAEGAYNIQWQMANGTIGFGEPTMSVPIRIAGTTTTTSDGTSVDKAPDTKPADNAQFLSISMPLDWDDGHVYDGSIMLKNTGTTNWIPGEYKMRIYSKASDNSPESVTISYIDIPSTIYAGTDGTVYFQILAPEQNGVYNARAQMYHNGMLFGEPSQELIINVH